MIFANLILTVTILIIAIKLSFFIVRILFKLLKVFYFIYRIIDGDFLNFNKDKSNIDLLDKNEQITKVI